MKIHSMDTITSMYELYIYLKGKQYSEPYSWAYKYAKPIIYRNSDYSQVERQIMYYEDHCLFYELFKDEALLRRWQPYTKYCTNTNRVIYYEALVSDNIGPLEIE